MDSTALRLKPTSSELTPHKRQRPSEITIVPSTKDIWTWTLTSDATAPCHVRDVFEMTENPEDYDFYWLGRVPCRNVRLVGLVIGVSVYPKKIVYSIDDGTAVVDCTHSQTPSPLKNRTQNVARSGEVKKTCLPPMPTPKAEVGDFIQVVGRVQKRYEDRQVIVTQLSRSSPNGELEHCRLVRELHITSYSLTSPFTIPSASFGSPQSFSNGVLKHPPLTKRAFSPSPAPQSSPPTSVASSPAKSSVTQLSPRKLRHPSRLHSKDFTANTFRIYMKHYMDNLPDLVSPTYQVESLSDCESDAQIGRFLAQTPTKRSQYDSAVVRNTEDFATPRPVNKVVEHTPRPRIQPLTFAGVDVSSATTSVPHVTSSVPVIRFGRPTTTTSTATAVTSPRGFTLSYLRRIPELSLLARKVTEAEVKRRAREERKKAKEAAEAVGGATSTRSTSSKFRPIPEDKLAGKMKRLFEWAIRALHKEGSIVLWDGPVRPCTSLSADDTSRLWKANNSTTSNMAANSTLFGSSSLAGFTQLEDDDGYLSDPQEGEEAYSPVTPDYLTGHVEKAMKGMRPTGCGQITIDGILRALKKDDRWRNLGSWSVSDTLELMCKHGRLRELGHGRWDLVS